METLECAYCGKDIEEGAEESTYCGSMHSGCISDHCEECDVCKEDFDENA